MRLALGVAERAAWSRRFTCSHRRSPRIALASRTTWNWRIAPRSPSAGNASTTARKAGSLSERATSKRVALAVGSISMVNVGEARGASGFPVPATFLSGGHFKIADLGATSESRSQIILHRRSNSGRARVPRLGVQRGRRRCGVATSRSTAHRRRSESPWFVSRAGRTLARSR